MYILNLSSSPTDRPPRPGPLANGAIEDRAAAKPSVVIVEDDFLSLLDAEHAAIDAGLEVLATAQSPEEALRAIEQFRPDFVLTDINLGCSSDGVDVALEAKKRFGIRSLFASAYSDAEVRARAAPAEPLGWIVKPYTHGALREVLRETIEQLRQRDS